MTTIKNITYTLKQLIVSLIVNYPLPILAVLFTLVLLPGIASLIG